MKFYSVIRAIIEGVDFRRDLWVDVTDKRKIEKFTDPKYGYNGKKIYTEEQWKELAGALEELPEIPIVSPVGATNELMEKDLPDHNVIDWQNLKRHVLFKIAMKHGFSEGYTGTKKKRIIDFLMNDCNMSAVDILKEVEQVAEE